MAGMPGTRQDLAHRGALSTSQHGEHMAYEYKGVETGVEGMRMIEDSTGGAEFMAGKIMTQQQASLHAPDSMGFDFQYGDKFYEDAMNATGLGQLGYTGYEGKDYETDVFDIDDRLDDVKFLHSPFVERSPAGGWPMKYALLGEYNPTMSSVIGTKTGYGAYYPKEQPAQTEYNHTKAMVPETAKDQWALPVQPESRNYGQFYKGPVPTMVDPRRVPPPTRYQSYTPGPPKPTPPVDCSTRPNRIGESLKKPDPAWGYTGHEFARRFDAGDEKLSMATRIAKRRKESIERRFGDSPDKKNLVAAANLEASGMGKTYQYGWSSFPPSGLKGEGEEVMGVTGEDLHPSQIRGPNNAQISSAKLYASNGN